MKKKPAVPYLISSISALHRLLELAPPEHPLISVINFEEIKCFSEQELRTVSYDFYCIALKRNFDGKMIYGQHTYDFDEGVMTFFSPGQVITTDINKGNRLTGWWLVLHQDYLRHHPLAATIKSYDYFSYAANEALYLSPGEENMIETVMKNIRQEYISVTDHFSQSVILSHVELLLNYCYRFYSRQFITRTPGSHDILVKLEAILESSFSKEQLALHGIPTVRFVSEQLNMSPNYLSDLLRSFTGNNTQTHIHNKLIDKAKDALSNTSLSISEIAYQLGFDYPQSFNKLFKKKMKLSPMEYRHSLN